MARFLYTLSLLLTAPLVPLYLLWRARRQPEYLRHWNERCGFFASRLRPAVGQTTLWLHAVSVGETRATQPLVKLIRQRWPQTRILLTHMTPTGRQTAAELYGRDAAIASVYLPYDFPWAMRRFLRHFRPQLGAVMETELWPNLVAACRYQDIPLLLVNARLSEKSARGYARFPHLTRETLQGLRAIAAQSPEDAARLEGLGAAHCHVTGNLKFDINPPDELLRRGKHWLRQWRKDAPRRRVLLAASTREGEEALILDAYLRHLDAALLLVIVPRHPQRFDAVVALATARRLKTVRRSALDETAQLDGGTQVLIGDSMGELFAYYAACDVAFIGGSLLDYGCQNLIEACAVGVPVLLGPSTYNFADAAQAALAAGAARQIRDADELFDRALCMLAAPGSADTSPGATFAAGHRGASERTLQLMADILE
nr:lipid IV(A) 3-deoxy-D-manno-octulosonic acid transferase [Sterolibacterium denitrificans]